VPAVNNLHTLGRWAFAELTEIYQIDADFKAKLHREFDAMLAPVGSAGGGSFRLTAFGVRAPRRCRRRRDAVPAGRRAPWPPLRRRPREKRGWPRDRPAVCLPGTRKIRV
jgi:hypothetical protein